MATKTSAATATLLPKNRDQNRRVLLTSSSSAATCSPTGTGSPPSGGGIAVTTRRSRELHLRVEVRVADVDDEVDEHEDHCGHEHDALDHRQVLGADRLEHVAPDPRQREDLLDDERAAEQVRELDPDDRHRRRGRVLHGEL